MGYVSKSGGWTARRPGSERMRRAVSEAQRLEPRRLLAFAPLGPEFRVNTTTFSDQYLGAVAADADGDFVVAYHSFSGDATILNDAFVQRYSATGAPLGTETRVNTRTAGNQWASSVAMDADGDFVVAWASSG